MTEPTTAIAGYGDVYSSVDELRHPRDLAFESVKKALDDASITHHEVDTLLTGRRPISDDSPQWNNILANELNIPTRHTTEVTSHGSGVNGALKHAKAAIEAGISEKVVVVIADTLGRVDNVVRSAGAELDADPEFENPYGHLIPAVYALLAQRYLHEYDDVSKRDMAKVAVEARKWGLNHPEAWASWTEKEEISVKDVLDSPKVCTPLNLLDCAPWGMQGRGGAFVVMSAEEAERLQEKPVYLQGLGEWNTHEYINGKLEWTHAPPNEDGPTLTTTGGKEAARQAYETAGIGPEAIDVAELHTNFTHIGLIELEEMGFCEKGNAGEFVRNGGIDYDGGLPVNTNGGFLSYGQTGIACVMDQMIEAVRQIRAEAVGEQVPEAETALVHGIGGMSACNTVSIMSTRRQLT